MTDNERAVNTPTVGLSRRADRVVSWVGWHLGELAGIGVPLVLATTVNAWFALPAGVVAASWLAHELRVARRRRQLRRTQLLLPPGTGGQNEEEVPGESA